MNDVVEGLTEIHHSTGRCRPPPTTSRSYEKTTAMKCQTSVTMSHEGRLESETSTPRTSGRALNPLDNLRGHCTYRVRRHEARSATETS